MKQRVEEMEREAAKLRELQAAAEQTTDGSERGDGGAMDTEDEKGAVDNRSVYVGNVRIFFILVSYSFEVDLLLGFRLTTRPHQKRFKVISKHVEPSTG